MDRKAIQTFIQKGHIDGQQAHEKMLNDAVIWEVQIKTTMRYHIFTLVRMAITKKSTKKKKSLQIINAGESGKKKELSYIFVRNVNWFDHYGDYCGGSLKK